MLQREMQVPAEQPGLVGARIEELTLSAGCIEPNNLTGLCQVAARTAQSQIAEDRFAAGTSRCYMLDVECHTGGILQQSAVFTCSAGACDNHRTKGCDGGHSLSSRELWMDPHGNRDSGRWRLRRLVTSKFSHLLGVRQHQLLGFVDQRFKPGLLLRANRSFRALVQEFIESLLVSRWELLDFGRILHSDLHRQLVLESCS
jgi:hypothetical protein